MYYLLTTENLVLLILLVATFFIVWRARRGDEKAQKTAVAILSIAVFVRRYFVFLFGAALFAASWYYGTYM